jgi:DNA phosphorothioation-associated putative methyltransferase
MRQDSTATLSDISVGKRVWDDLYVHRSAIIFLYGHDETKRFIESILLEVIDQLEDSWNIIKVNLRRKRISFLEYLNFDDNPFPILNRAWIFEAEGRCLSTRSYSLSINPPILHRKELLVGSNHPRREEWVRITSSAEALGLFACGRPIGFKLNWQKLIEEKGYRIAGDQLLPMGNEIDLSDVPEDEPSTQVQRHLTALSRSTLSAPVQLMITHGLITQSVEVFDYGCGKGDDIRGLTEIGVKCRGWDPHFANQNPKICAEIVNLGFVVNVIEDPAERVEAIQAAFALAKVALVVSVMLHSKDRPGTPYLDGFLTSKNTFQKYFSQEEFKDYLEGTLGQDAITLGPGIALIFVDKDAEQRFLVGRHRSSNVARRLLSARMHQRAARVPREQRVPSFRVPKSEREFEELRPTLELLWKKSLDLGRFPEQFEVANTRDISEKINLNRAKRLIRTHFDLRLLQAAAQTRADDIKLFFVARQFMKKAPYKELGLRLKTDIKHFFGDYKTANQEALALILKSAQPDEIRDACETAASDGIGWLEESKHSLQLHISLLERLPGVLRAYVTCGLILWDNLGDFQLIKIHVQSGKLSLLQYSDFDTSAVPLLVKRIKINIPKLDYDVFEYGEYTYPPPPLLFKSRYMHEDMGGFAEQLEFDDALEATGVLDECGESPTLSQLKEKLSARRLEINGLNLTKSTCIPSLDQNCGRYLKFRDLIQCGETQSKLGISNLPRSPQTYNALYSLSTQILDPVIEYFGSVRLTYGFCSPALGSKISSRVAPKLDQHASHECNKHGKPICHRLGAAVDFMIEDEDMVEVAIWISENLTFDRMYIYGRSKPMHISLSEVPAKLITFMIPSATGRLMPRACAPVDVAAFAKKFDNF